MKTDNVHPDAFAGQGFAATSSPQPQIVPRLMDGWWLCAGEAPSISIAEALARNATLPAGVKLVPAPRGGMQLWAEVPADAEADSGEISSMVIQLFHGACASFHGAPLAGHSAISEIPGTSVEMMVAMCTEAGWEADAEHDRVRVRLQVEGGRRATLAPVGHGWRAGVRLGALAGVPVDCAEATAHFLAAVGACVRGVRAVLRSTDAELEFLLPLRMTAPLLEIALSALGVAFELCGREVAALLADEGLARAYLEDCARHTAPPRGAALNSTTQSNAHATTHP